MKEVMLPASVRFIGKAAFKGCDALYNVSPIDSANSFIELGNEAFKDCPALEKVSLTPKVIPPGCFENCINLDYTFGDSVQRIEQKGFKNSGVHAVGLLNSRKLTHIGAEAFADCRALKTLKLPATVQIGDSAFEGCRNLENAILSNGCRLGEMVFMGCKKLTKITWPSNLNIVPYGTFCECMSLSAITGGEDIRHINDYAFYHTLIRKSLFKTAEHIGREAFGAQASRKGRNKALMMS